MSAALSALLFVLGARQRRSEREDDRRHDRELREEERREQRRREAAQVLAPVYGLLVDVDPARLAVNAPELAPERVDDLRRRWESEGRPPLLAIAAGYPSPTGRLSPTPSPAPST